MGRPPKDGNKAMTGAERVRKWRAEHPKPPKPDPSADQTEIDRLRAEIAALRAHSKPQEPLQDIAASILSLPQQKRFAALERRLREEMEARIHAEAVQQAKREWVDGYLLPKWGDDIRRLRLFEGHKKPFTAKEYRTTLLGALHPDRLHLPREEQEKLMNEAFRLVSERKPLLAEEPVKPMTDTLPKTLAEMMARRRRPRR